MCFKPLSSAHRGREFSRLGFVLAGGGKGGGKGGEGGERGGDICMGADTQSTFAAGKSALSSVFTSTSTGNKQAGRSGSALISYHSPFGGGNGNGIGRRKRYSGRQTTTTFPSTPASFLSS